MQVGERSLREVYLKPFQMAVKDAKPLSIMTRSVQRLFEHKQVY